MTEAAERIVPKLFSLGFAAVQLQVSVSTLVGVMEAAGILPSAYQNDVPFIDAASLVVIRQVIQTSRNTQGK